MLDQLKSILSKVDKKLNMDAITEETHLVNDLKLDSLAMMLFAMEIEVSFNFRFTEPVKFETVGDVCRYLENRK